MNAIDVTLFIIKEQIRRFEAVNTREINKKAHRSALLLDCCVVTSVTIIFYNPANKVTKLHTITTAYKA